MKIDFLVNIPILEGMPDAVESANKRIALGKERGETCVSMAIADAGANKGYRHIVLGFRKAVARGAEADSL